LPVVVFHQVDEVDLVAGLDPVFREVDDDVEAFGDALGRQDRVVVLQVAIAVQVHAAVERHACSMRLPSLAIMWNGTRL
jgi:hypothetical protein